MEFIGALAGAGAETWRRLLAGHPDKVLSWRLPAQSLVELRAAAQTLLARIWKWLLALASSESRYDPIAAALAWNLLLWAVVAWAAVAVRRYRRPLLGVAPAGALLVSALSYSRGSPTTLLALLITTLPLMAVVSHSTRQHRWQADSIDYPSDIGLDLAVVVIGLTLTLATASVLSPNLSIRQAVNSARHLLQGPTDQAERIAGSLGLQRKSVSAAALDRVRAPGLPRRHLIGSGPELSEQIVLLIRTDPMSTSPRAPYHWRALTYDQYTGSGWFTGRTETLSYGATEPAGQPPETTHRIIHQEVRVEEEPDDLLYATGTLLAADPRYWVSWRVPPAAGAGDAFGATISARNYQVDSWIPNVTEAQLRAAGADYPSWVRSRYLALPRSVPARVHTLARKLTATAATAFDQAQAIEDHLRTYAYSLDLPDPPIGQDIVDYFLFDLQRGYCDYYATAMVVLARAAGLPSRLVVGYASGAYDEVTDRFVVTEADAHSWAEIYFPPYGWIEFEPTAAARAIDRPDDIPLADTRKVAGEAREAGALAGRLARIARSWWPVIALPTAAAIAWLLSDSWRLRRLSPSRAEATLYRRLLRFGHRMGVPVRAADTPFEFAALLIERLAHLAQGQRRKIAIAPAMDDATALTCLYVRQRYGPHAPNVTAQTQAIQTWRRLRWRLWLAWVWNLLSRRT
jgi:transglutaminase-like putative cysteine protease